MIDYNDIRTSSDNYDHKTNDGNDQYRIAMTGPTTITRSRTSPHQILQRKTCQYLFVMTKCKENLTSLY